MSAGHYDVAMVLGFDKMTSMIQSGTAGTAPENMEDAILPAGFFAMWATRRMHERGTKPEHLARIAAKNFNNGAKNPMSQRQAEGADHAGEGAAVAHGGVAADDDDVVPDRRRRRLRHRRHASSWRRSCAPIGRWCTSPPRPCRASATSAATSSRDRWSARRG